MSEIIKERGVSEIASKLSGMKEVKEKESRNVKTEPPKEPKPLIKDPVLPVTQSSPVPEIETLPAQPKDVVEEEPPSSPSPEIVEEKKAAPVAAPPRSATAGKGFAPAEAPQSKKKKPIRMELPLGDPEDEDAVDPSMSLAEVMKKTKTEGSKDQDKRSKMWGVDMSKFTDD